MQKAEKLNATKTPLCLGAISSLIKHVFAGLLSAPLGCIIAVASLRRAAPGAWGVPCVSERCGDGRQAAVPVARAPVV